MTMTRRGKRMESGRIIFGIDWPGLFLRGDDALGFAPVLAEVIDEYDRMLGGNTPGPAYRNSVMIHQLVDMLFSVGQGDGSGIERLKEADYCRGVGVKVFCSLCEAEMGVFRIWPTGATQFKCLKCDNEALVAFGIEDIKRCKNG